MNANHLKGLSVYFVFGLLLNFGQTHPDLLTLYAALAWFLVVFATIAACMQTEDMERRLVQARNETPLLLSLIFWVLKTLLIVATALSGYPILAAALLVAFLLVKMAQIKAVEKTKQ